MTRIILVRHGETQWNKEGRYQGQIDTELSEEGYRQTELVADALKDVHLDAFYGSPLKRSYLTAQMVAKFHNNAEVKIEPRFTEISHGEWEGLLSSEVDSKYGDMVKDWKDKPHTVHMPGGEHLEQVQQRSMAALYDIVKSHPNQTVLIAAHDAINKVIICGVLEIGLQNFWRVKQDNTGISILEFYADTARVCALNDTCHLGGLITNKEQKAL